MIFRFSLNHLVLQSNGTRTEEASQAPCLKVFKKYLIPLGQYSYQTELSHKINVTMSVGIVTSLLIPAFEHIFDRISQLWEIAEMNGEVEALKEVTDEGSRLGSLFRSSLWIFATFFLSMPLCPVVLDYILPLNETRARLSLFKLNYIIVDTEDHFYIEYFHSAFSSIIIVLIIATFDSLYMVIVHYGCGLFALCGYQVKKAAEIAGTNATIRNKNDLYRRCVITHHEAIRFYESMDESTRTGYLLQVVFTMIAFIVNAVQAVLHMDRPNEFIAILMFMCGQQFHQFALCLPGQVLIDRSLDLIDDM
nr:PREDICTED: uncharacterized protein LOC105662763 [Megachile rotundata]